MTAEIILKMWLYESLKGKQWKYPRKLAFRDKLKVNFYLQASVTTK